MKPALFEYVRAESVDHAVAELAAHGDDAAVLAGGQSLIALMNLRLATPAVLVDIGRVSALDTIAVTDGVLELGATVRASRCERDGTVRAAVPVLSEALRHVGHPQIRSRTTIGGNIAHADPASELPAVLIGLDGAVELTSEAGVRTVSAHDFFQGTWTTARRSDELLTSVDVPIVADLRTGFVEFARRPGDFALAGAFVGVRVDGDELAECRIALCGVADVPLRLGAVEAELVGKSVGGAVGSAAEAVRAVVDPAEGADCSAAYRRQIAGTVVQRALRTAIAGRITSILEATS